MRVAVIGSGLSGLTAAALLAKRGHEVTVYEQHEEIGGVTSSVEKDGFRWDLGQMLVPDLGPGEPGRRILEELEISDRVEVVKGCRANAFPDFGIFRPDSCPGPYWRKRVLAEVFPSEAEGLDRYYRVYDQVHDLVALANRPGRWARERFLNEFFGDLRLKAVFSHILADYSTFPRDFPGLLLPIINPEPAYDERVPLDYDGHPHRSSWTFIRGGTRALVDALAAAVSENGGTIRTRTEVRRILLSDRRVVGLELEPASRESIDAVVASGGAVEVFCGLVGREHLPKRFLLDHVDGLPVTSSVLMVHLGVDTDPSAHQNDQALCYYYETYDIDRSIREIQANVYHEGRDGWVLYIPSKHSPEMAPPGNHAVTVYTVAPHAPANGTWAERGEEWADKLLDCAEKYVPGLRQHALTRVVWTPENMSRRTHLAVHAFGGCPPRIDRTPPRHRTPIRGLWFVGAQSEAFGGVTGAMTSAQKAVAMLLGRGRAT